MLLRPYLTLGPAQTRPVWHPGRSVIVAMIGIVFLLAGAAARADDREAGLGMLAQKQAPSVRLALPMIDPRRGRDLFVAKGCVLCHAVNNVGGRAGPALEPPQQGPPLNFFVYPYVVVDGQPLTDQQVTNQFEFQDR